MAKAQSTSGVAMHRSGKGLANMKAIAEK